jgi:hypothetical protein
MYLICFEIERNGFILEAFSDLELAKKVASTIFNRMDATYMVKDQEEGSLELLDWKIKYRINGNMCYCDCRSQITGGYSNGAMTYWIIDTEIENFNLHYFIRERENSSYVFELDDDKVDYLAEEKYSLFFAN